MTDQPERIDLSSIDPTREGARTDRAVKSILDGAAFELARRRTAAGTLGQLAHWHRPMAVAAALAVLLSSAVFLQDSGPATEPVPQSFTEYMGLPNQVAQWVGEETLPSATQILFIEEAR